MDLLQWRDHAQVTFSTANPDLQDDPKAIAAFLIATARLPLYEEDRLAVEQALGSGTSFQVFACRDEDTGSVVAVKRLRLLNAVPKPKGLVNNTLLQELKIAAYTPLLRHQNITQVLGFEGLIRDGSSYTLSLVTEFSDVGSLAQVFETGLPISALEWTQKCSFAIDVTSGLEVLHACHIIHSDMKPENVLLFKNPPDAPGVPFIAKVSDFGNAIVEETQFEEDMFKVKRSYRGTAIYTAPFVRDADGNIPFHIMPKADIHSLGLLIWSIFKGQHFFLSAGEQISDVKEDILLEFTAQKTLIAFMSYLQDMQSTLPAEVRMRLELAVEACLVGSPDFDRSAPNPAVRGQIHRKVFSEVTRIKKLLKFSPILANSLQTEPSVVQEPFMMGPYTYNAADEVPLDLQTQRKLDLLNQIENTHMTRFQKGAAALQLSAYSAAGFGCKKDILEALDFFNLAATLGNVSAQLLIHRVCEALDQPSPVLDTDRLPLCSETGSEGSDDDAEIMTDHLDDEGEDNYEDTEMQTSESPQVLAAMTEVASPMGADDLDILDSESTTDPGDDAYAEFHIGGAINLEFYKQANVEQSEWFCWNARFFIHRFLSEILRGTPLFLFDKRYPRLNDPALLSKALEACSTESCPTVQLPYSDGTRGDASILHHAVAAGEFNVVKAFIDKGIDVNLLDLHGETPLLLAAEFGHKEITEFLIERGAKANIPSPSGEYPLHRLWMYDNVDVKGIAKRLVHDAGADVNAAMKEGVSFSDTFYRFKCEGTALQTALTIRSHATVAALLAVGADVNTPPYDNSPSPLELAAQLHMPEIVDLLLAHGANLLSDSTHGSWALHEVGRHVPPLQRWLLHGSHCTTAASATIHTLLKAAERQRLDPNSLDNTGLTAFEVALEETGEDDYVVKAFLDSGFSLPNRAALHATFASGFNEFNHSKLDMVLAHGARLDVVDEDGLNPLHHCAVYGALAAAGSILKVRGADCLLRQRDNDGNTPLHWAARTDHAKVLEMLVSHGAELDMQDSRMTSALGVAIESGSTECTILLLQKGADIMLRQGPWTGSSILIFAVSMNPEDSKSMLSFLLSGSLKENEPRQFPQLHAPEVLDASDTNTGNTALHRAAAAGDYEGVITLLRAGASPALRNSAGRTPVEEATLKFEELSPPAAFKEILLQQRLGAVLSHISLLSNEKS